MDAERQAATLLPIAHCSVVQCSCEAPIFLRRLSSYTKSSMSHMPRPAGVANLADLGRDCDGRALTATMALACALFLSTSLYDTTSPVGVGHNGLINNVRTFSDHANTKRARYDTEEHASTESNF